MKSKIENEILNFFINSNDFNGIPLREISKKFNLDYAETINIVRLQTKLDFF